MATKKTPSTRPPQPAKIPDKTIRGEDLGKKNSPMRERMAEDLKSKQHGKKQ